MFANCLFDPLKFLPLNFLIKMVVRSSPSNSCMQSFKFILTLWLPTNYKLFVCVNSSAGAGYSVGNPPTIAIKYLYFLQSLCDEGCGFGLHIFRNSAVSCVLIAEGKCVGRVAVYSHFQQLLSFFFCPRIFYILCNELGLIMKGEKVC